MNDTIETRWEQQNEAGRLSFTDGDLARAEQSFLAAIREATQLGADNVRLASSLSNLGQLKYKQKDFAQAEALFHRALAIRERVLGPEHFGLVQNINNLAALHYARGELDQAEPLFQRALGISQQHLGESHPDVAVTLNNLARLYFRRNEYASAGPLLERLLAIKEQALGISHPEIAAILTSLAKVRLHQQDYDGGEQFARRALEIREKLQLPNDLAVATALETLADINAARGRVDEEIRLRERALEVRTGAMGPDHAMVVAARAALEARRAATAPAPVVAAPLVVEQPVVPQPVVPQPVVPQPVAQQPVVQAPPAAPPQRTSLEMPELHFEPPFVEPPKPAEPPQAAPVAPPPSFTVSPPPARTTRTSSLPWIDVPEPPTFDRTRPTSAPRNSGSNGTVTMPLRNGAGNGAGNGHGNGNGNGAAAASHTAESPLAFHPLTEAPPVQRAPTPPASMALPSAEAHAQSPFTNSFARLVAETPSGRNAIAYDAPPAEMHHIEEPRAEISLDWPIEPRRPWLKIIGGMAALALIAGGGWFVLSRYDAGDSKAKVTAPVTKASVPIVAAKSDTTLVQREAVPPGPPASVVKPGVTSEIVPAQKGSAATKEATVMAKEPAPVAPAPAASTPANNDEGPPADAKHATHVAAKSSAPDPDPDLIAAPAMPSIKVDAITNMIDDSARQRADSVGRTIQQKAPTFKPKAYKPPS